MHVACARQYPVICSAKLNINSAIDKREFDWNDSSDVNRNARYNEIWREMDSAHIVHRA